MLESSIFDRKFGFYMKHHRQTRLGSSQIQNPGENMTNYSFQKKHMMNHTMELIYLGRLFGTFGRVFGTVHGTESTQGCGGIVAILRSPVVHALTRSWNEALLPDLSN